MLLKYFYDPHLAQASYLVGCQETGEALIIDPARDITPYLQAVASEGLRLAHVTETHIHADFVSGVRELVAATGARLYLSDMGDSNWKYAFANQRTVLLRDGDKFKVGNVKVEVIHTPGHTPEHLVFQITDTLLADRPMGLFTGDCIFVGNIGRPDLLEEAAGIVGTKKSVRVTSSPLFSVSKPCPIICKSGRDTAREVPVVRVWALCRRPRWVMKNCLIRLFRLMTRSSLKNGSSTVSPKHPVISVR